MGRGRGRGSAAFEQHDPGEAAELLALLFRVEPGEQAPQPGQPHGSLEAQRLVPGRAKLRLAPTERLAELRTLRRGELERRVAGDRAPPALLQHLEQPWSRETDPPP